MTDTDAPPKVFISYRWSSPAHEDWVLRLATSLRASGIDAQLDKWHLKEGQDTLAFMEGMVTDPTIRKVLLVCDAAYVERANSREGGVGTEAQIISAKVYQDTDQDKFAAIVVELDEQGRPLLPLYMNTRLYFDMSDSDAEAVNFDKIVRWILNEPFHALPPIGQRPDFSGKTYVTGSPLFRIDAVSASNVRHGPVDDAEGVLQAISDESENFLLQLAEIPDKAEEVRKSILSLRPVSENGYRALRQILVRNAENAADILHSFFETLLAKWDFHPVSGQYTRWDNDAYQYFVHDLFVSFVSIAMKQRAFDLCGEVLSMPFYKRKSHDRTGEAVDYTEFRPFLESLEALGKTHRRVSMHADLLFEAHDHSVVGQTDFMEADLTLYLRGVFVPSLNWYPISALYLSSTYGALPTYVRAKSTKLYERLKPLLVNTDAAAVRTFLASESMQQNGLRFDYRTLDVARLIAAADLSTAA